MQAIVIEFRPRPSGGRRGFVDVALPELGMTIRDVVVFSGNRGAWCKMPARRLQVDEDNITFMPYLTFDAHQAGVIEQAICAAVDRHIALAEAG